VLLESDSHQIQNPNGVTVGSPPLSEKVPEPVPEKTTCSELLAAAATDAIARIETTSTARTTFTNRVL